MNLKSILVANDRTAAGNAAVQRAHQLARAHSASVTLVNVPNGAGLRALAEHAIDMDFVVLPHTLAGAPSSILRRQPLSRLLRRVTCPVLVTRGTEAAPYKRILVAVDFSAESETLVMLAAGLDAHAELVIFHAVDLRDEAKLRSAEATEHAVRAFRERCAGHAKQRMLTLRNSFDTRRNRVLTMIGQGDPGRQAVIQQEHSGAGLVVVGKGPVTTWKELFFGSIAHRILADASSDVLVVPHAPVPAAAPLAAHGTRTGGRRDAFILQPVGRRVS